MSDPASMIIAISTLIGTVVSSAIAAASWFASRRNHEAIAETKREVVEVKAQTNGLSKALVEAKEIIAKAEGKAEERAEVAERVQVAQEVEDRRHSLPPGAA